MTEIAVAFFALRVTLIGTVAALAYAGWHVGISLFVIIPLAVLQLVCMAPFFVKTRP